LREVAAEVHGTAGSARCGRNRASVRADAQSLAGSTQRGTDSGPSGSGSRTHGGTLEALTEELTGVGPRVRALDKVLDVGSPATAPVAAPAVMPVPIVVASAAKPLKMGLICCLQVPCG